MGVEKAIQLNFKPLYLQVKDKLAEMIENKVYKYGEKLPSEPELARMFGVSRSTVREASRSLAQEGIVMIRHGLGTFVTGSYAAVKSDIEELHSITKTIAQRGWIPGTIRARMHEEPADDELIERLQMEEPGPVIHIERVRTANGKPVFYSVQKLVKERVGDQIFSWDMEGSLLEFLEKKCGISVSYSVTEILPVENPGEITEKMGIERNIPILLLDQLQFDVYNRPIFRSHDYYRTDIFKFHIIRRRRQTTATMGERWQVPEKGGSH
ncbi:MAG TPA: GntR family transcriptional regulator [Firmicutes bacterium]|nr:GntR family transcriptional regulator [Bacillota bacterium]